MAQTVSGTDWALACQFNPFQIGLIADWNSWWYCALLTGVSLFGCWLRTPLGAAEVLPGSAGLVKKSDQGRKALAFVLCHSGFLVLLGGLQSCS